tara:strand:+ start:238 stop:591 length:354 start_codon:yes stop_codon:yes gene_type:complete
MKKKMVFEIGQGTSLRSNDYSRAGVRAVENALWKNSLNLAQAFGFEKSDMIVDVTIGVQKPDKIDIERIKKIFPYGVIYVKPQLGGLDIPETENTAKTIIAVAAIVVSFEIEVNRWQ